MTIDHDCKTNERACSICEDNFVETHKTFETHVKEWNAKELRSVANMCLGKGLITLDDYAKICRVNKLELF